MWKSTYTVCQTVCEYKRQWKARESGSGSHSHPILFSEQSKAETLSFISQELEIYDTFTKPKWHSLRCSHSNIDVHLQCILSMQAWYIMAVWGTAVKHLNHVMKL